LHWAGGFVILESTHNHQVEAGKMIARTRVTITLPTIGGGMKIVVDVGVGKVGEP
jgi:hypothetical protein